MKRTLKILFYLNVAILFSQDAKEFYLKSGDRVSGTISGETDSTYTIETVFGTVTLNKANIQTDEEFIYIKSEDHKRDKYIAVGFLDHKTGLSLIGYARTFMAKNKHEIFIGVGTVLAANTIAAGWKYYLTDDSPVQLYSVVSIQGIAGMGGSIVAPFVSIGGEKSITEKLYINGGLNTIFRLYNDKTLELLVLPSINLNWRY
tara:strand:+ start:80 stop:688 length:609 start_codon:yes stop_codon:yes gene_type:complete